MSKTHWKKLNNPNYLGAYSLDDGKDIILTIKEVKNETVVGTDGKRDECIVAHFMEPQKPMILNATNCKMIANVYKTPYIEEWAGKKIQIYIANVRAFGQSLQALRVRSFIPHSRAIVETCENCGKDIVATEGYSAEKIIANSRLKFGRVLCFECAKSQSTAEKGLNENNQS